MLLKTDKKENKPAKPSYIQKFKMLAADYFIHSNEKLKAWFLLISTILAVIALVALTALLAWWSLGFWAALIAKDLALLVTSMLIFGGLIIGYICANSIKNYFSEALSIEWRSWLTEKLIHKYLKESTHLRKLSKEIDIEKVIQDDVGYFTENTITIGLNLLRSTLSLGVFFGILWVVGASFSIPGYLALMALSVAVITAGISYLISAYLPEASSKQEQLEADFQNNLKEVRNNAQTIVQEKTEEKYLTLLSTKFKEIYNNAYEKLGIKTRLNSFRDFCAQLPTWLPYLTCIPLFFAGQLPMVQLLLVGFSFGIVSESIGSFFNFNELNTELEKRVDSIFDLEQYSESEPRDIEKLIEIESEQHHHQGLSIFKSSKNEEERSSLLKNSINDEDIQNDLKQFI